MTAPIDSTRTLPDSARPVLALVGALLMLLALVVAGCSGDDGAAVNQPPVIDSLEIDSQAIVNGSGFYEVKGWLSAHDPDGLLSALLVRLPSGGELSFATGPTPRLQSFPVVIRWDAKTDATGPLTFEVAVRDDELGESAALTRQVAR